MIGSGIPIDDSADCVACQELYDAAALDPDFADEYKDYPRPKARGLGVDGAAVTHEDLAAHLIGAAIRANTGHVDVLVEAFASSLLADFNITRREAAGE